MTCYSPFALAFPKLLFFRIPFDLYSSNTTLNVEAADIKQTPKNVMLGTKKKKEEEENENKV
jgi:hypothetical protein